MTSTGIVGTRLLASAPLDGQGWREIGELALAFGLAAVIGTERELRQKDAGMRTHALVGVGAALFMLISKYGFGDVLAPGRVVLDPSRVAAQIVTGIGFLGAGIIFVRRDSVRGLTTAATIWLTAAIGAAAGAGLAVLAIVATAAYFVVTLLFPLVARRLPKSTGSSVVRIRYPEGRGVLRELIRTVTGHGFVIDGMSTEAAGQPNGPGGVRSVEVTIRLHGKSSLHDLAAALSELDGVETLRAAPARQADD